VWVVTRLWIPAATAALRTARPCQGSPSDLTQRPYPDALPEPSLYVLSPTFT
jgi:hypothetical protein